MPTPALVFDLDGTLVLGACQTAPPPETARAEGGGARAGDVVVSALGTPFYLAFKGVVCVASVAMAAPVAGLVALSDSPRVPEVQATLGDGVSRNCGPPYVLHPPRTVALVAAPVEPAPLQTPGAIEPRPLFTE